MIKLVSSLKQYQHDGAKWNFVFPKSPKKKGQCRVIFCKRPARVQVLLSPTGKLRTLIHPTCDTCKSRLYRANNPAKDAYRQIKDRAKRRNQIFDITFEDFLEVIRGTEYLTRRGTGIDELHLDRKEVGKGYVRGNLEVITAAENLRKQREVDYCREPF